MFFVSENRWDEFRCVWRETQKEYDSLFLRKSMGSMLKVLFKAVGEFLRPNYTEQFSEYFNKTYYYKNFLKNLIALWYVNDKFGICSYDNVIDIGCGGAPSALAYLISQHPSVLPKLHLYDKSKWQLRIAKKFLKSFNNITIHNCDICHANPNEFENGLIFMSYFVCEQPKKELKKLVSHITHLNNSSILIVDYKSKTDKLRKLMDSRRCHTFSLKIPLPDDISMIIEERSLTIHGLFFK